MTDPTGSSYEGVENMSARLMPDSIVRNNSASVKDLLMKVVENLGPINYFLGGNINSVPAEETAVNPSLRSSVWSLFTTSPESAQIVRDFIPNSVTGVCYNHHNSLEPDWRKACWGSHYDQLDQLKEEYDPSHVLNCWHCVGYIEGGKDDDDDAGKITSATDMTFLSKVAVSLTVCTLLALIT